MCVCVCVCVCVRAHTEEHVTGSPCANYANKLNMHVCVCVCWSVCMRVGVFAHTHEGESVRESEKERGTVAF